MPDAVAIAEQTAGWSSSQYLVAAVVLLGSALVAMFMLHLRSLKGHRDEIAALQERNHQTTRETYTVLAQVSSTFPEIERRLEKLQTALTDQTRQIEQCHRHHSR